MYNWFKTLVLIALLYSCGGSNGTMYQVDNLEIYYSKNIEIQYVKKLGAFFKDNHLIHPTQKHSVKLTSSSTEFLLKMILNDTLDKVPVDILKEIEYLEDAIAAKVFENRNFAIEITDAYFNPIIVPSN